MHRKLSDQEKAEILMEIRQFFAEELEIDIEKITPDVRVIDDLGGDSLMYLELIELFKKKYNVTVEMRLMGQYFQNNPMHTVAQIAQAVCDIVEGSEAILGKSAT